MLGSDAGCDRSLPGGGVIRVLHFADIVNEGDFIHNVVAHCDYREFVVSVATLDCRGTLRSLSGGVPVVDFDAPRRRDLLRAISRLRSHLEQEQVQILHAHHYAPSLIALLASRQLPVALVIGRHYSDAIHRLGRGVRRLLYLRLEALTNDAAACIVAPSLAVERVLLRQGVGPRKIVRIPYGFDFDRLSPRPAQAAHVALWGQQPGLRLATFARLHPEKGHRYLVEALAKLARAGIRATWLVVGDGPARRAVELLVQQSQLEAQVRFLGWRTDPLDLMAASDVVVQPTLHEAFSQVMVEAMALGRPLVISNVSGVEDVVRHAETGLVVPPGDPEGLVHAIRRVSHSEEAERIGGNAMKAVRDLLDIRTIAPRFETLYRGLAKGTRT
jgi:glycosyltransferase involved in cell wall biosynthesis